jgi:hypothetical protein
MNSTPRYKLYTAGTKCSVEGCSYEATHEVYLYDYYAHSNEEFFQQDFTCPFICSEHLEQNEREMVGERIPRGSPRYPFTNKQWAQGYTKYAPISDLFPEIYATHTLAPAPILITSISAINDELISYLARHPEFMYQMNPRRFEELVAELLRAQGFRPTLTPQSRDGGRDIIATRTDTLGELLYLVECKRYAPNRKVGVQQVRGIFGVAQAERATKAVLVTTSSFTGGAVAFASPLKYDISLRDFQALKTWLTNSASKI